MKTHILLRNNHYDTRVILNLIFFLFDIHSFFLNFPFFSNMDIYIQAFVSIQILVHLPLWYNVELLQIVFVILRYFDFA